MFPIQPERPAMDGPPRGVYTHMVLGLLVPVLLVLNKPWTFGILTRK